MALDPKLEQLVNLLLTGRTGVPITLTDSLLEPVFLGEKLAAQPEVPAFFPECADVLLSLCRPSAPIDEIDRHFTEYFSFSRDIILLAGPPGGTEAPASPPPGEGTARAGGRHAHLAASTEGIDPTLAGCVGDDWPPHCCLPDPCVFLDGDRDHGTSIVRLFAGDLMWAYWFERLGIPKITGVILDDYATKGTFPISTGFLPGATDEQTLMVLEAATRQTKNGLGPTSRDRESAYRRGIGWTAKVVQVESQVNRALSEQFLRLSFLAGQFFTDKRLAVAVRGAASATAPASVSTLISIKDTIVLLQNAMRQFYYGRTYHITLATIVWLIAGMSLIRSLRQTLGIPETLNQPEDYITAAWDKFFGGGSMTSSQTNRYLLHRDCARSSRDILLDVEMLDTQAPGFENTGGILDRWLDTAEARFETFRNSYRALTGIDLATTQNPQIDHQA